jgi:hypothetical protein
MSNAIEYSTSKVYALVIRRTSKFTESTMTSVLFYSNRQAAEKYAVESVKKQADEKAYSNMDGEYSIVECDLSSAFSENAFIIPVDYAVNTFISTK